MHPASDDPATRTALAALQVGALRWLGGGAIAVVLGVLLGVATVSMAGEEGRRVPGAGLVVLVLVLGGLAAVVVGAGALLRTNRWRRALATTTWRPGRLYVAGAAVLAFEPDGGDDVVHLRLLSTAIWRTRAVQALDGAAVIAAPVAPGQWVFTAEGAGTLYGARAATRGR
ncbi:hypothetical protein E9529_07545 [Blastococcus sp. KM273128]|uniref:hypothetical protein n=1 Tax=Blastococcus sp. KM273128 TaxID=2570314 RepID=UPI001F1FC603|nr:hypothetical protein [Blastococcus sp. KM273128]MCF6744128.1 hypothetical protein [Blastococcus sp. KM273128]